MNFAAQGLEPALAVLGYVFRFGIGAGAPSRFRREGPIDIGTPTRRTRRSAQGQARNACRVVRPSHACSMSRLPSLYPERTGKMGSSRPRAVGLGREGSQKSRPAGWERLSSVRRCPLAGLLIRPHRRYPGCGRDGSELGSFGRRSRRTAGPDMYGSDGRFGFNANE